jgi:hypothetical protein
VLESITDNLSLHSCLAWLWAIAISATVISIKRFRDIINPVTGALASTAAVTCLLSAAASCLQFDGSQHSEPALKVVMAVSSVFIVAVVFGALIRIRPMEICLSAVLRRKTASVGVMGPLPASAVFLLASTALLAIVAIIGGGGIVWIQNPRMAYLTSRAGAGLPWAASGWALTIAVTLLIYQTRSLVGRMTIVALGCLLGLQLGTKAIPLALVVISLMHQHWCVKPVRPLGWGLAGITLAAAFSCLLWLQRYDDLTGLPINYFAEYSTSAARGIDMLGPDGWWFTGSAWTTSMWEFVPRSMVAEKPFAYGIVLLLEELNPGMAELGHTAGVPSWILGFMEAGLPGVMAMGFAMGQLHSAVFHVIGRRVNGPADLLLLIQVGVFPILLYSNPISTISIYYLLRFLIGDKGVPFGGGASGIGKLQRLIFPCHGPAGTIARKSTHNDASASRQHHFLHSALGRNLRLLGGDDPPYDPSQP